MTDKTPDLTIPGPAVAELGVRVGILNKVLTGLVGRTAPADSEMAGLLRLGWEHGQAIAETVEGAAAENAARGAEIGLWSLPTPIAPWDWRSGQRGLVAPQTAKGDGVYHGNRSSHVFHRPSCRYYWCKNCVVEFTTRDEAISAGYRPCGNCRP